MKKTEHNCDTLGVCQSTTKPCGAYNICARKKLYFFAPGTIEKSGDDEATERPSGWVLELRWYDWFAGLAIVAIVGAIAGMAW
jgi:hypothetical protein